MKRTIIRYAVLLTLLGAVPHPTRAAGGLPAAAPELREIATDSLQRLCGGRLPLYASGGGLWLEIPKGELRLAVQLDHGAGMRNRVLPSLPPFRIEADPTEGVARLRPADTLRGKAFRSTPLPLVRIAGTERLLAGIDECLYTSGEWYDCSVGILRNRRYGHESLPGVDTTACGTLVRIGVWYDVESPERSTEIQIPSGALPLEIELYLTVEQPAEKHPAELVVSSTLPEEYADVLRMAVDEYNRRHRRMPLHTAAGGEVIPLTTPYGISYDAPEERITVHALRIAEEKMPSFVRINLGTGSWEQEALHHTLQEQLPYRTLRRLLTDAQTRRRQCLEDRFTEMLEEAFRPVPEQLRAVAETPTEKRLKREFRDIRIRLAQWERFMREEAPRLVGTGMEIPEATLYEAMQSEMQRLYVQLAEQSRGTSLQGKVLEWIARGLIADAEGRFSTPLLRDNGLTATPRETARRQDRVWKGVLASATPESLAGIPELFGRMLDEEGGAAFAMQESFLGELTRQLEKRPEFAPAARALEALYTQLADGSGSATALFADIERLRLEKIRTENQEP